MTAERITFVPGRGGELEARFDLDGVTRALRLSKTTGSPALVSGPHPVEEMYSYYRAIRGRPQANFVAIGHHGLGLNEILYNRYAGRQKVLRRITSFLSSYVIFDDDIFASKIESPSSWPDNNFFDHIANQYVASRKKPEGAEAEIYDFINTIRATTINEAVVLRKYFYGWNAEQAAVLQMALSTGSPIVLLSENPALASVVPNIISTTPVTYREAFNSINKSFNISIDVVSRHHRLWVASRYRRGRGNDWDMDDVFPISSLGDFVNFLLTAVSEGEQDEEQKPVIPVRIVAPIMFQEGRDNIVLDHTSVTGITYNNAIGAVRALRNITADIRDSGILSNVVFGINPSLDRICNILGRIADAPTIEESDIVEFGVEFSYVQSRILNAHSSISSESMELLLAYTGEGFNFLERFEPWQTYKAEGGGSGDNLGLVNRDIADASIRLLRSAAEEGLLDAGAARRVVDAVDSADIDAPLKRASLAASSQNLGAAVGRTALAKSGQVATDVLKGAEVEAKRKLSLAAVDFIHRHAVDLAKIATTESGRWLAALLKTMAGD